MPNYVDEPPSLKERFDALESILAIQRKRLEDIECVLRQVREVQDCQDAALGAQHKDLTAIKKAVGCILLGLAGQPVNVGPDLLEALGFKTSPIVPASAIHKAS